MIFKKVVFEYLSDKYKQKQKFDQIRPRIKPTPTTDYSDKIMGKDSKSNKVKLAKDDLAFLVEATKYNESEIK